MYIGNEPLLVGGHGIAVTVNDFWRWAYSDLSDAAIRDAFADFLVASSLDLLFSGREETGHGPLWTPSGGAGLRVGVCAAAYVQSHNGEYPDHIAFDLPARREGGQSADVYVCCVFRAMAPEESPLNTDLWDFYVLRGREVCVYMEGREKLTLPALMRLKPVWCDYYGIGGAIREVMAA